MDDYNRGGHSKYSLKVHLIFVTKYRKKIFKSDKHAEDVKQFLYDVAKKYGYEIVPDSTIPELTNEFTFTEQRVINKITWKSGIIRIYARDYYFNGNYISTQCFII